MGLGVELRYIGGWGQLSTAKQGGLRAVT